MLSDTSKMVLVGLACTLGIFAGVKVSSSWDDNPLYTSPSSQATEQRLLLEEEASNQIVSGSAADVVSAETQSPKWQLVIEKVPIHHSGCSAADFNI